MGRSGAQYKIKMEDGSVIMKRINYPWRLWEPVGWWWQQLTWSEKDCHRPDGVTSAQRQVTMLELVIDFEIATGIRCDRNKEGCSTWGEKAELLTLIIKGHK